MYISQTELDFAADVRRRDAIISDECKARGFTSKRSGWTSYPSGTTFSVAEPANEERSRAEVIEFRNGSATRGLVMGYGGYTAYLSENPEWREHCGNVPKIGADNRDVTRYIVTTFVGDKLAEVTAYTARKVRNSGLTDTRGSFWARGIDGRIYHGRHNGPGMYCRMRAAKRQPYVAPDDVALSSAEATQMRVDRMADDTRGAST